MTVNYFGEHIQLNNFATVLFVIVIVAVVVIAFGIQSKSLAKKKWHCPNCDNVFRKKWTECIFVVHWGNDYSLRCPECGKKNFCNESKL